ncbi:hypothetical protein GSI_14537 [Ganoderma sinense ZZ0214-1]|uniref:Dihydrolipoamide acetyltransferase component of pyruvate dehydrogenase complex n=1 Tax=Ganoderma sinense ZZ0214-1 TaxID=1077348 RepID=A0A2G8RNZ9_9APHY|nr:hypothetical protein GSI_14537 [Ganoderma sinense ZZ0214-1]
MRGDDVVASLLAALPSTPLHPSLSRSFTAILHRLNMLSRRLVHLARGRALHADAPVLARGWKIAGAYAQRASFHSTNLLQAETVKVPQMAESISEGTLKTWLKQVGDTVAADEEVATIETDKIDVSVNAPAAGRITELLFKEEDTVTVGQDLFRFEPGEGGEAAPKEEKPSEEPKAKVEPAEKSTPSPPSLAPEPAQKPEHVKESPKPAAAPPPPPKPAPKEQPAPAAAAPRTPGSRNETRVKMSRMRLRIAERLKESQNAAASLTTFNEIDMSSVMELRKKYKDEVLKEHGVKLGFMSAFAKAATLALREIPAANASIEGDEIVYRDYVDLSVAVATPKGLVTPVVRNAESMNFVQIEQEIANLSKKVRVAPSV